ncbi:DUF6940 family protein [Fodinibius sp. Rm-B-1B1-1]|uniref:DUF6940 family protein n=1 Tax=Fodinibius alkaliphilus TaxID=3140241 RepID=UPI003159FC1C
MFTSRTTTIADNESQRYQLFKQQGVLSYSDFLYYLENDEDFQQFFIDLLSDIPFRAYHWETPPVTKETQQQPFEFVVTKSPGIDLPSNPGPFRQYLDPQKSVITFDNLGGDAKLIAPTPSDQQLNYSHIGVFTKQAPQEQQKKLWQIVGRVTLNCLSSDPIWLNTAGGGVAWLHVRLDSRPKYYLHHPYTSIS